MTTRKIILLTIFTLCVFSCVSQKPISFEEISYNAITRGRNETIKVTKSKIYYKTLKEESVSKVNAKVLNKFEELISKIQLAKIDSLKAPSDRRFFDGAMATEIQIKTNQKTYTSSSFDDTNPPKELKELVTLLQKFRK